MIRRILIKGASGAGKSTLGQKLANRFGLPYVELDALHHGPRWQAASAVELRAKLLPRLEDLRGWVIDGNYDSKLETMLVDRAELIVWLDIPLSTKLWRLTRRTTHRLLRKQELWNGNRETVLGVLWGRDALFAWAVRTHFRHRRDWPSLFSGRPHVRLRSALEVEAWLVGFNPAV